MEIGPEDLERLQAQADAEGRTLLEVLRELLTDELLDSDVELE